MSAEQLDLFLMQVEKRAFRMARLATRNDADALDIVQDSMLKLVSNYRERPAEEWKPLFYRILEHRIMDWHRQQTKVKRWFFWKKETGDDDAEYEGLPESAVEENPLQVMAVDRASEQLLELIETLPVQQQQCFLLRNWEGLSVKETAEAMGVSDGSVKTHYFRAVQKLTELLEQHEIVAVTE